MSLYDTFNIHKETVLFSEGGFNVKCILKPSSNHTGYKLNGFSTFTGCTFSKDGEAFFGDTFELTINLNALQKHTKAVPMRGWIVSVEFPQLNYKWCDFTIENAPLDRTLGTVLLRCSAFKYQPDSKYVTGAACGQMSPPDPEAPAHARQSGGI